MASATSNRSSVRFGTNANNQVTSYYETDVTTLGGGGLKREIYRTDPDGTNRVLIQIVTIDENGNKITERTTNITDNERRALKVPGRPSPLKRAIKAQVEQATRQARANEAQASNGGQTDIGKENGRVLAGDSGNDADNDNDNAESRPSIQDILSQRSKPGTRSSYATLRYPIDIAETRQDIIKFDVMEYIPQEFGTESVGGSNAPTFSNARRNLSGSGQSFIDRRSIGSVILPIPGGIKDQKSVDWGGSEMNVFDVAKADIALTGISKGLGQGVGKVGDYANFIKENPGATKTAVGAALAAAAVGPGGKQLLSRTTGMIMNPNMELLFKGPKLRSFGFSFSLSPRSRDEARAVKQIIRLFKQAMSPQRTGSSLFLKSPNTFGLRYIHRGEDGIHKGLNAFKECALLDFSVDYTPNNNYATYEDGTPVQYIISMQFNELETIYNDEYDLPDDFIGF